MMEVVKDPGSDQNQFVIDLVNECQGMLLHMTVQYSKMDYMASATPYVTQIDGQWICRYLSQMPGLLRFPDSVSFIAGGDELIRFDLMTEE